MIHTQEPWHVPQPIVDGAGLPFAPVFATTLIAKVYSTAFGDTEQATANARRIVACVNACRGLSTDDLEKTGLVSAVGHELLRLEQQRDDLLTALSYITALPQANGAMKLAQFRAEQAIAKVKGGFQ